MSRRQLLRSAAAGVVVSDLGVTRPAAAQAGRRLAVPDYLTRPGDFVTVERGNPVPYKQPEAKLRQIGLTRETWKLEVVPDTSTGARVDAPLSIARGTALDWGALMRLAETRAVRYLKVVTCNNLDAPLGMGLWEGVPLRDVVWLARPVSDIRRVYYYGHHNEDPKQMFRGSLSLGRVLEDPPGDYPVILAYKLNGELLTPQRGGPVRMIVPEAYGFKSVKWLQRIVLTDVPGANDTYADENNDIDSCMKTFARFLSYPQAVRAGEDIAVLGVAQAGLNGLSKVQVWLRRESEPMPPNDPYLVTAPWRDAAVLPPPARWGGGTPWRRLPDSTLGVDPATGRPRTWPMRYAIAHWTADLRGVRPGSYELRCRTIDAKGVAQPMPRPLPKSGVNTIEAVSITVRER